MNKLIFEGTKKCMLSPYSHSFMGRNANDFMFNFNKHNPMNKITKAHKELVKTFNYVTNQINELDETSLDKYIDFLDNAQKELEKLERETLFEVDDDDDEGGVEGESGEDKFIKTLSRVVNKINKLDFSDATAKQKEVSLQSYAQFLIELKEQLNQVVKEINVQRTEDDEGYYHYIITVGNHNETVTEDAIQNASIKWLRQCSKLLGVESDGVSKQELADTVTMTIILLSQN
jgi:hypothetical protein